MQALTAKYGLPGFKTGCEILFTNLEKYWNDVFPKLLDEDGEDDPYYRINALSLLTSDMGVIKQVYDAYLLTNGLSNTQITVRQAINLLTDTNTNTVEYPGGRERLILDIRVSADNNKPELESIKLAVQLLESIENIYQINLPNEQTPKFDILVKPLSTILKFTNQSSNHNDENPNTILVEVEATTQPEIHSDIQSFQTEKAISANSSDSWRKIALQDRKDVELVLEKVCIYFEEYEPSHPAPLFIRRIQRLMNMDFYDIIKDINPEGINALEVLIGKTESENANDNDSEQ